MHKLVFTFQKHLNCEEGEIQPIFTWFGIWILRAFIKIMTDIGVTQLS